MTENIPLSTRLKNCGIGILRILIINFYFFMTNTTKPSRQEMIDAIYEKIANKDLSFGCRIFHKVESWKIWFKARIITDKIERDDWIFYWVILDSENSVTWIQEKEMEIIGHPVMLGDVMEYFYGSVRFSEWGKCWRKLTKPIEEQSDECIEFIYKIIS